MAESPIKVEEEKEMSFLEHLEELRWHLIRSILSIVIAAIVFFAMKTYVFNYIVFAPKHDSFATYKFFCSFSERTCFYPPKFDLITRELGEQFFTHIKVSLWLAIIVMFPYIFYEFWKFIKPGLHDHEKRAAGSVVFTCTFLFFLGVAFGYYVISPFAITFLAGYQVGADAINSPTLASYVSYLMMFTLPTGFVFQMPLAVYFLAKLGVVTPEAMKKYRKHAMIMILILAAIITPPDVVTQFLIGIPVFLLYELSIVVARRVRSKKMELEKIENQN